MKTTSLFHFKKPTATCSGSTFLVTILMITVLSLIAAHTLFTLSERWRYGMEVNSWQEAESAAESGADMAIIALNTNSWDHWKDENGHDVHWKDAYGHDVHGYPVNSGTSFGINCYSTTFTHTSGEGSQKMASLVQIDAPASLSDGFGAWYRIRSTGISELPKTMHIGYEPSLMDVSGNKQAHANLLRKFSFNIDESGGLVNTPQTARTVEVIARAPSPFSGPITLNQQLTMSGGGWIDAFDSSNPAYSTGGQYDSTKRLSNTTVNIIDTKGKSDLKNTIVYGNVKYNGPDVANAGNVQGTVTKPSTATTTPVPKPSWVTFNANPTLINGSATLNAGTSGAPARYKLDSVNVSGGKVVTLHNPTPGQDAYVQVWVTGDFQTSGSGYIQQEAGVHVTYYIEGDINISGSSFNSVSGKAEDTVIFGVTPTDGSSRQLQVSGGGNFIGAVDAPGYDVNISGSANFSGALIGNTMNISGGASIHYDNALSKLWGASSTYKIVSWVEDIR